MPKRTSNLSVSLRQLGEIQVNDWDFKALLQKDISELEVSRSLRRLGNLQVMDWDLKTVLPAVNRLAHQEIDLLDIVKRTASFKVMEWDFRSCPPAESGPVAQEEISNPHPSPLEMQALASGLKNFLDFVVVKLIDRPDRAEIGIQQTGADILRFKLTLVSKDVAMLIGREGHTASAIRSILKACGGKHGVRVFLEIQPHGDDLAGGA